MLEQETVQAVNRLIQGMVQYCISAYSEGQSICPDDLKALSELITAINVPSESHVDPATAIGFTVGGEDE